MQRRRAFTLVELPALRASKRAAFTLVELLVVIGIIAVLISLLLPALGKAQRHARQVVCMSNERQLIQAVIMYAGDWKGVFPGGPGYMIKPPGPTGTNQYEPRLASWDTEAQNPYSCNADPQWGPTFLAKYVGKSTKIGGCPGEPDVNTTGSAFTSKRTSYWYSMSLVYKPEEVQFPGTFIGPLTPQTPQKLTSVRHPTSKIMIIERQSYHEKVFVQSDRGVFSNFAMGFVDGHVLYQNSKLLLDRDTNWTGRGTEEPGILGRDVPP
jgi:prepilin-type N-terminal cleavage/methylation domain-containing protein